MHRFFSFFLFEYSEILKSTRTNAVPSFSIIFFDSAKRAGMSFPREKRERKHVSVCRVLLAEVDTPYRYTLYAAKHKEDNFLDFLSLRLCVSYLCNYVRMSHNAILHS